MPTSTKTHSKMTIKSKKRESVTEDHVEEVERMPNLEAKPSKAIKPIEIEEPDSGIVVDDKTEEDPLAVPVEEDDSAEEISLDGEEVNPFGDRWEE